MSRDALLPPNIPILRLAKLLLQELWKMWRRLLLQVLLEETVVLRLRCELRVAEIVLLKWERSCRRDRRKHVIVEDIVF